MHCTAKVALQIPCGILIDRAAGEIIRLVVSVCVCVCPLVCPCACVCVHLSVGALLFEPFDL